MSLSVLGAGVALGHRAIDQWGALRRPGATPDAALLVVAAGAALALILWLTLSTVAVLLSHVPGRCGVIAAWAADAWAPSVSRRLAGALLGVAAMGAVAPGGASAASPTVLTSVATAVGAVPAGVAHNEGPGFGSTVSASAEAPNPGWLPTRPMARADATPALLSTAPRRERDQVVVRRGDTLWDLARRDLGPDATDAEVARSWPRWYAANRQAIGPDPGRLLPGQVLRRPGVDNGHGGGGGVGPGAGVGQRGSSPAAGGGR